MCASLQANKMDRPGVKPLGIGGTFREAVQSVRSGPGSNGKAGLQNRHTSLTGFCCLSE